MEWNYDVEAAPIGEVVESTNSAGRKMTAFKPIPVLVSVRDNGNIKVFLTYRRNPSEGEAERRWSGLATGQEPYAWMPMPDPAVLRGSA